MMEQTSGFYARALRVIGQDLAPLVPENLAIELQGENFVVHGLCSKSRAAGDSSATGWGGVRKLLDKVTGTIIRTPIEEPDLEFVPFSRTYDASDIDRLDGQRTHRRGIDSAMPDIYTLGE
ncbi:MAG TPA: hypothetical protein VGB09_07340, partial [Candidatus Binatia bacterium]